MVKAKVLFFSCDNDKMIGCAYVSPIDSSYTHSTNTRTDYFNILAEQVETFYNGRLIFRNVTLEMDNPLQFGFKANARTFDNLFCNHS